VQAAQEPVGSVEQGQSGIRYAIEREGGTLRLKWGNQTADLLFFIGSRRMGRSYAWLDRDYLYQVPVGYYTTKRAWDMAPGYEQDRHADLDRPITTECLFCHASGAKAEPGTLNRISNWTDLHGITCERCHGDGTLHATSPKPGTIINPARLRRATRSAVCQQCHLAGAARIMLPGKSLEQYRPGEKLSDYMQVFINRADTGGVRVNGHAEALARSRCSQSSELWCGTCHNPHNRALDVDQKCAGCHTSGCSGSHGRKNGCVECHMAKSRAFDGGHTVFTDHSIPRRPQPHSSKAPGWDLQPWFDSGSGSAMSERNLGLAYASVGELDKAWPLLRAAAQSRPKDAHLYAQLGALLEADQRTPQASEFYRLALSIDPNLDLALTRLAVIRNETGDHEEARRLALRALARNPRQPEMQRIVR